MNASTRKLVPLGTLPIGSVVVYEGTVCKKVRNPYGQTRNRIEAYYLADGTLPFPSRFVLLPSEEVDYIS